MSKIIIFWTKGGATSRIGVDQVKCNGNYWIIVYKDGNEEKIPAYRVKDIR